MKCFAHLRPASRRPTGDLGLFDSKASCLNHFGCVWEWGVGVDFMSTPPEYELLKGTDDEPLSLVPSTQQGSWPWWTRYGCLKQEAGRESRSERGVAGFLIKDHHMDSTSGNLDTMKICCGRRDGCNLWLLKGMR